MISWGVRHLPRKRTQKCKLRELDPNLILSSLLENLPAKSTWPVILDHSSCFRLIWISFWPFLLHYRLSLLPSTAPYVPELYHNCLIVDGTLSEESPRNVFREIREFEVPWLPFHSEESVHNVLRQGTDARNV